MWRSACTEVQARVSLPEVLYIQCTTRTPNCFALHGSHACLNRLQQTTHLVLGSSKVTIMCDCRTQQKKRRDKVHVHVYPGKAKVLSHLPRCCVSVAGEQPGHHNRGAPGAVQHKATTTAEVGCCIDFDLLGVAQQKQHTRPLLDSP